MLLYYGGVLREHVIPPGKRNNAANETVDKFHKCFHRRNGGAPEHLPPLEELGGARCPPPPLYLREWKTPTRRWERKEIISKKWSKNRDSFIILVDINRLVPLSKLRSVILWIFLIRDFAESSIFDMFTSRFFRVGGPWKTTCYANTL